MPRSRAAASGASRRSYFRRDARNASEAGDGRQPADRVLDHRHPAATPMRARIIFGRGGSLEFPFPVAAKTGTSQAYHDNWTIGYSRHVTVGVWVGNFDRTPLRNSSGVTGAGPIFHAVMLAAEKRLARGANSSDFDPFGPMSDVDVRVQSIEICALSGLAANPWCPARRREWVAAETGPLPCSWHHLTDGGLLTVWPARIVNGPEITEWTSRRDTQVNQWKQLPPVPNPKNSASRARQTARPTDRSDAAS